MHLRYTKNVHGKLSGGIFMRFFLYSLCLYLPCSAAIRDIFQYDLDWNHADYEIVAQGTIHQTGKTFKVLQCGCEVKMVLEK